MNHPNRSKRDSALREAAREVIGAAKTHIVISPAFRSKPIGAPGSTARLEQDDKIAAEDALKAAIAKLEAEL